MEHQPANVRSALHVYELASEYVYALELPPVDLATIEVFVDGRRVTVVGGVDSDPECFGKSARPCTAFRREITLADDVDLERLEAGLSDGSLDVRAPKVVRHHRRKLPVRTLSAA